MLLAGIHGWKEQGFWGLCINIKFEFLPDYCFTHQSCSYFVATSFNVCELVFYSGLPRLWLPASLYLLLPCSRVLHPSGRTLCVQNFSRKFCLQQEKVTKNCRPIKPLIFRTSCPQPFGPAELFKIIPDDFVVKIILRLRSVQKRVQPICTSNSLHAIWPQSENYFSAGLKGGTNSNVTIHAPLLLLFRLSISNDQTPDFFTI